MFTASNRAARRHSALKDIAQIMVIFLIVFMICFMWVNPFESVDYFNVDLTGAYNNSQASMLMRYLSYDKAQDSAQSQYFKSMPYRVEVPGNEALSNALTIYNFYAYHLDEAIEIASASEAMTKNVNLNFSGIGDVSEISWSPDYNHTVSVDDNTAKLIAIGIMGRAYTEIGKNPHADHPEGGNNSANMYEEWNSFTHEQKLAALNNAQFMNTPLTAGSWNDGRSNRWGGYNPPYTPYKGETNANHVKGQSYPTDPTGNRYTGKWGYGLIQFTGGRRINMANWAELNGYNFEEFDAQLYYSVVEFMRKTTGIEYVVSELSGRNPANDADCERAVQLMFGEFVYHGGGVSIPAGGVCSSCGKTHTDSNDNLYKHNYANTDMSILEVCRLFDSGGPEAFGGHFATESE